MRNCVLGTAREGSKVKKALSRDAINKINGAQNKCQSRTTKEITDIKVLMQSSLQVIDELIAKFENHAQPYTRLYS